MVNTVGKQKRTRDAGRSSVCCGCLTCCARLQVTTPTAAMKAAMVSAELGDDVFGDDPTVIALENMCAATFGKPAGLFVPSGTMGNLIAVMTHCNERASELIIGDKVPLQPQPHPGASGTRHWRR